MQRLIISMLSIDDIQTLFDQHGHEQYTGEPVTQLEHALQAALLAEQNGANDELITAALLHDIGHLIQTNNSSEFRSTEHNGKTLSPTQLGIDDVHQYAAIPFLRGLFSNRVLGAIQMHVDAKRYLCATRPDYFAKLSTDSVRSLAMQGGIFSSSEAAEFIQKEGADQAVQLRVWDDLAKTKDLSTPTLSHYLEIARRCSSSESTNAQ
jgi:phosphonate degradation associated HDIG domain protein